MRALIFNESLAQGDVPDDWRQAKVSPVLRKGKKYDAANYRPVLLTCIYCTTLEHIADFIGLPYFSGCPSGLKSHVLISHDFLSQSKFVPLPRDQQPCARGRHQNTKRNSVL